MIESLKTGFFKGKFSGVTTFVCTECGHVELFAKNPSFFKKEE
ncbi:hypothetical protein [Falsibacillus albus]|nr:hypothetical protein [Falsibacillus albus]